MSVSTLALDSAWRDFYGMWNSYVEPQLAPLEQSKCHVMRLAMLPDTKHTTFPAHGKIEYNFHLVPGSLIWGLWMCPDAALSVPPQPSFQLTDVTLGHQLCQAPATAGFLITPAADTSPQAASVFATPGIYFPSFTLLPTPHPVVGDGLFTLEAWGQSGSTFYVVLGVAEVTSCPVK